MNQPKHPNQPNQSIQSTTVTHLTKLQKLALDAMLEGKNVFLTGPSGTGKSLLIHYFYNIVKNYKKIAITSTTGISALLIGGSTLHSYLGIGLGAGTSDQLTSEIRKKEFYNNRWKNLDILVIDEVSMLSPDLFDKLEKIARNLRCSGSILKKKFEARKKEELKVLKNGKDDKDDKDDAENCDRKEEKDIEDQSSILDPPFGGIQIILSGDFLQLPVVGTDAFCFESKCWNRCVDLTFHLKEIIRQNDVEFQEILNDLRFGIVSKKVKKMLDSRIGVELKNDLGILPTEIHTTNRDVNDVNERELDKLMIDNPDIDIFEYEQEIYFYEQVKNKQTVISNIRKNCLAPVTLQLCKGAQVMLLCNLDMSCQLANGSRGVVTDFVMDKPIVKFLNGEERMIEFYSWELEEGGKKTVRITQLPLKLAYACTVHKCVIEGTIIATEYGLQRIEDICLPNQLEDQTKNVNFKIMGKDGLENCTQIYKGKFEHTLTIETTSGYTISGSYRHPLLVYEKGKEVWKTLPELKIGDYLLMKKGTNCYSNYSVHANIENEELSYCLGFIIFNSDYSKLDSTITFFNLDDKKFSLYFGKLLNKFSTKIENNTVSSPDLRQYLLKHGLKYEFNLNPKQNNKLIPWYILLNNMINQLSFIQGSLKKNELAFESSSVKLLSEMQTLLLNLGVETIRDDSVSPLHSLRIKDISLFNNFFTNQTEQKCEFFLEKITKITKDRNRVYDVYIPESHSFIGNGFVNHNSQGATLDYAIVNLEKVFTHGQTYVALSRVKNKDGLSILGINYDAIQAHPKAIKYYKNIDKKKNENS